MLYIYVKKITDRCLYTFDFVLSNQGIAHRLTNDRSFFEQAKGKKFNYSTEHIANVAHLSPASLLFEDEMIAHTVSYSHYLDEPCLAFNGITDPLAAVFFVLSRMEEYQNPERDHHKRFSVYSSVLFKMNMHDKLVCDRWTKALVNELHRQQIVDKEYVANKLTICPTFDIDIAYAYLQKSGLRQLLSIVKDFITGNTQRRRERKAVLSDKIKDPYDTFSTIAQIAKTHPTLIFWLLGNYNKHDKNIAYSDIRHRSLIRRMAKKCTIGIHPSYFSNTMPSRVQEEVNRLEKILNQQIVHSRQHFLKLHLPTTYQQLLHVGITDDYTMGYASQIGFRAGTLRPFKWFDLSKNQSTELTIHPFAYMDGTLCEYQSLSIAQAQQTIRQLYEEAKLFGGDFYFIWHNSTIGNYRKWNGWQQVLNYTLQLDTQQS